MSDSMSITPPPPPPVIVSKWRRVCANLLGFGVVCFVTLWLLVWAFVFWQISAGVFEGGELVFAAIFITAPPVLLFTILALCLVGPSRCKLAWISALFYFAPFVVAFLLAAIGPLFGLAKP